MNLLLISSIHSILWEGKVGKWSKYLIQTMDSYCNVLFVVKITTLHQGIFHKRIFNGWKNKVYKVAYEHWTYFISSKLTRRSLLCMKKKLMKIKSVNNIYTLNILRVSLYSQKKKNIFVLNDKGIRWDVLNLL